MTAPALYTLESPAAIPTMVWHWGRGNYDPATGVVIHDAGLVGATGGGFSAFIAREAVDARETLSIEYDVSFSANWRFGKSGKLPGLYGGRTDLGPDVRPTGYNGFSVRPCWVQDGRVQLYVYDVHAEGYGRGPQSASPCLFAGHRHRVRLVWALNTVGNRDGSARLFVDGALQAEVSDCEFRRTPGLRASGIWWASFFGGGDASFAPTERVLCQLHSLRVTA